jgi:hypothetical protein
MIGGLLDVSLREPSDFPVKLAAKPARFVRLTGVNLKL